MDIRLKPVTYWTSSFYTLFTHKICALNYPFWFDPTETVRLLWNFIFRIYWEHMNVVHITSNIKLNERIPACWQHSINSFHFIKTCKSEKGLVNLGSVWAKVSIHENYAKKGETFVFFYLLGFLPWFASILHQHQAPICIFTVHRNRTNQRNWTHNASHSIYTSLSRHLKIIFDWRASFGSNEISTKLQSHFRAEAEPAVHSLLHSLLTSTYSTAFYWLIAGVWSEGLSRRTCDFYDFNFSDIPRRPMSIASLSRMVVNS